MYALNVMSAALIETRTAINSVTEREGENTTHLFECESIRSAGERRALTRGRRGMIRGTGRTPTRRHDPRSRRPETYTKQTSEFL